MTIEKFCFYWGNFSDFLDRPWAFRFVSRTFVRKRGLTESVREALDTPVLFLDSVIENFLTLVEFRKFIGKDGEIYWKSPQVVFRQ